MTLRLPLLLLALTSLPFSANIAKAAESGITLRLIACEENKEQAKVFLQTKDSKSDVFDLPTSGLTKPMAVSARSVEIKAPDNEVPLCSITLPAEGKAFAVLLAPQEPAGLVPLVVRLDEVSFKAGDYCFVNHSANTVVLKLGGNEVVLEAGDTVKSRPTDPVNNNHYIITMSARSDSGDRIFASARWPLQTKNRSYIIIMPGANGKTTYRAVDEVVN
jgi:hypothetical protein